MALSNIFNEPKKEIHETLVGLGLVLKWVLLVGGVWFTMSAISYFCIVEHLQETDRRFFAAMTPVGVVLIICCLGIVHEIGEDHLKKRAKRLER